MTLYGRCGNFGRCGTASQTFVFPDESAVESPWPVPVDTPTIIQMRCPLFKPSRIKIAKGWSPLGSSCSALTRVHNKPCRHLPLYLTPKMALHGRSAEAQESAAVLAGLDGQAAPSKEICDHATVRVNSLGSPCGGLHCGWRRRGCHARRTHGRGWVSRYCSRYPV